MSLAFGLTIKPKTKAATPRSAASKKPAIFDDSDSDADTTPARSTEQTITSLDDFSTPSIQSAVPHSARPTKIRPPTSPPRRQHAPPTADNDFTDLASDRTSARHASSALSLDASIYDYDAYHTAASTISSSRKAAAKADAVARKPKYMDKLLDSASRRKQDQLVAREKLLQKEREAEGDEFADKDKFVTGAYKKQQEEVRQLEEEEARRKEAEESRRAKAGGGMAGFYRSVLGDEERRNRENLEVERLLQVGGNVSAVGPGGDATPGKEERKSDAQLAAEMRAKGVDVVLNEEGQVVDKRQLLSAGLNVAPAGTRTDGGASGSEHLRSRPKGGSDMSGRPRDRAELQRSQRERQTKMLQEQLELGMKRAADEEAEERRRVEHAAKSKKTSDEVGGAKERYLARKREREEAAKHAQQTT